LRNKPINARLKEAYAVVWTMLEKSKESILTRSLLFALKGK